MNFLSNLVKGLENRLGKNEFLRQKINRMEIFGYKISKFSFNDPDFEEIYQQCQPYTMTPKERMYALYKATEYLVKAKINGDFVECGVWRGGSAMVVALTLLKMGDKKRKIYLYDTFTGMDKPTKNDFVLSEKTKAIDEWQEKQKNGYNQWCFSGLEEVKKNMLTTGYPLKNFVFVKGKVEDTIPQTTAAKIALLRLDTDWYTSTRHELIHLFPRLVNRGILLIDDYGYWAGSKKAVDEYFSQNKIAILLNWIDHSARIGVKTKKD